MTVKKIDPKVSLRRWIIKGVLLALYVGAIALTLVLGKVHTILIDNKDVGSLAALDGITVSIDGKEALELYPGDRDRANVKGQVHKVVIESVTGGEKTEKSITLPFGEEMVLLSLPKVVAGQEPYWEHFVPLDAAPVPGESVGNTNEFTSPDAALTPDAPFAPPVP